MAIGARARRIDAVGKVTGETLYPGDLARDDMLHMKILFAGRPHARLLRIDTSRAEAAAGVVAVFTACDVPVNEYGLIMPDQPVLVGDGGAKPGNDVARFVGDQVAVVVAESEKQAAAAVALIETEWQNLPVVTDPLAAMEPDALRLFPDRGSNIIRHNRIRRGDVDAVWENCAAIVEATYQTPYQEHAFLQPEAGVAYLDAEERVTVEVAGQWTHEDQEQIAHALGLPLDRVRVIYPAIGGAFGGREDMSIQIVLGLAALRLAERGIHRPVKIVWSREESIIGHHKRHPFHIYAKWGADADGKILAAECRVVQDAGAYAYTSTKVLGNATVSVIGPYDVPNAKVDAYSVYTNNIPGGAFRGFGGPQGAFVSESQVTRLAEKLGLDPVEMRLRNLLDEGVKAVFDAELPAGVTIKKVVQECARIAGWTPQTKPAPDGHIARGRGFACAYKNVGFSFGAPEQCFATVELHGQTEIERVVVYHAGADCGQGAHTAFVQMAADAAGVPVDQVELIASDTATTGNSGSASASRMTFMAGNAIRGAVEAAKAKWTDEDRPAVAEYRFTPRATTMFDPITGACDPNITYGYVAECVDVEVDTETGHVRVTNVTCADDVGRAINPQQIEGQIEGAIVQAHGYTILEHFIMEDGYVRTPFLSNYLIPTVLDVPDRVDSVILEYPDPQGPWGARGMAEMPYLPYPPAVTHAVRNAIGIWLDEFPLTPDRVLAALKAAA
ncbi:MAG: xanthine dehydrogenase family protein molybdopterin-binding subunit [Anaerolineales bacterium]